MKSLTRGNIKTAIASVRSNKWRSLLTMLGIIIGIVSVVTIVSIGEGVKHDVVSEINHLGKDLIIIRPGQPSQHGGSASFNLFTGLGGSGVLTDHDLAVAQQTPGVKQAVPLSILTGTISFGKISYPSGVVIGTTPDLPEVLNQKVNFGAFFGVDEQDENGAIIGAQVARNLFNQDVPLGQSFTFQGQPFVVRGIFSQFDSAPLSLDTDFNNAVFIPYQVARDLTNKNAPIYEILAKPVVSSQANAVENTLRRSLLAAHGNQPDFTVLKQNESLAAAGNILNLLTALIGGVAAISLLVGGIGIMNVMLVSVTERMHEIGIRKAIGATSRQIMSQFLIEATVLSVAGGVIGIVISFIIDFLLHLFTPLQPIITWQVVGLAVGVSLVVGVVFGTAPAVKAAGKDPIDALRNE